MRFLMAPENSTELFTGTAPGNPARDPVPMLVARRRGTKARFFVVIEAIPEGQHAVIKKMESVERGLKVTTATGSEVFAIP